MGGGGGGGSPLFQSWGGGGGGGWGAVGILMLSKFFLLYKSLDKRNEKKDVFRNFRFKFIIIPIKTFRQ